MGLMQLNSESKIGSTQAEPTDFDKGAKAFQWRKSFQQVACYNWTFIYQKKNELRPRLIIFIKINLKLIMNLGVKI